MSELRRFSLRSDYRACLVGMFPQVTPAQLLRFDELVVSDRLLDDEGQPHAALEQWIAAVLGDEPPEAALARHEVAG